MEFFSLPFWQDFVGNLLATIIGVVIGIPVALYLNSRIARITEKEKKVKILQSLEIELSIGIGHIPEDITNPSDILIVQQFLQDETWKAFSEGGELQWINDIWTIQYLAFAYGQVRYVRFVSEKYLDLVIFKNKDIHPSANLVANQLTASLALLRKRVGNARNQINLELMQLQKQTWIDKILTAIVYRFLVKLVGEPETKKSDEINY